jgi:tetratricopeptide (TPR) repeat protein
MAEYEGYNGRIILDEQALLLIRRGVKARVSGLGEGTRRVPFQALSDVRFKDAGRLVNGYLQFGLAGIEPKKITSANAATDPDTVLFVWKRREEFHQLYAWLQHVVEVNRSSGIDPSTVPYNAATADRAIEIIDRPTSDQRGRDTSRGVTPSSWPVVNPPETTPERLPHLVAAPVWMPGDIEVEVVGEAYRRESVSAAAVDPGPNGVRAAVLVPEPPASKYPDAVAVYVQTYLVGYLAKEISNQVHRAVLNFAASRGGQLPSCPAEFYENFGGRQALLLLDPHPLGLPTALFSREPELAKTVERLLGQLDQPSPLLQGRHDAARQTLMAAMAECAAATDTQSDERPAGIWPRLEHTVKKIIHQMESASDPKMADAWLTLARCTRFQKGRRDDTLTAYINCLQSDRGNADAWSELFEYICTAPHVPMLVNLYQRVPSQVRPTIADHLLAVSYGADRHGNLSAHGGMRLRATLKNLAVTQQDQGTIALLSADAGRRAEKAGDQDTAIAAYREAIAAGSTDSKVADRLSIWLVKQGLYAEAAAALTQALQQPPKTASTRDRLEKRLQRCQRALG